MTSSQILQSAGPVVSRLVAIAVAILVVTGISFVLAKFFGGSSRDARKTVYLVSSLVGFAAAFFFIFMR